jgi:putative oxidoreductase
MTTPIEAPDPGFIPPRWAPYILGLLRIVVGFLFMVHGTQKLFGMPVDEPRDPVALTSLIGIAGILETFGGLLIVLGLFTRPIAFLLAGEMAVAYFRSHAARSFWPALNGGEPAVLFCFVFLYLATVGGGAWALDRLRTR